MIDIEKLDKDLTEHLESLTKKDLLEYTESKKFSDIKRLEVINHNSEDLGIGRIFTFRGEMEFSLQDDGKTLKIFI